MPTDFAYPSVADILAIHEDIMAEQENAQSGVRSPDVIESALTYVSEGYFDQSPDSIHAKAAHLMRLIVSEHPFVDGNKRTALNTMWCSTISTDTSSNTRTNPSEPS